MRHGLLLAALLPIASIASIAVTACSGSSATIDPPGETSSSSSGGTATATATPPDSAFRGGSGGCGNLTVSRGNADGTQFLVVVADKAQLGLAIGSSLTFDLARLPAGLEVGVDVFPKAPAEAPYCSDAPTRDVSPTRWTAEGGSITIQLQADTAGNNGPYRATVRLKDVRLVGPERGVAVSIPSAEIASVLVGWLPG